MEVPQQNYTPRPKPRVPRSWSSPHTPSHPINFIPVESGSSCRPGLLVEAKEPFSTQDVTGMLRWQLGQKVGGEDQVREISVSPDKIRAVVEFVHPRGRYIY